MFFREKISSPNSRPERDASRDKVERLKIAIQEIGFDTSETSEGIRITIKKKSKD